MIYEMPLWQMIVLAYFSAPFIALLWSPFRRVVMVWILDDEKGGWAKPLVSLLFLKVVALLLWPIILHMFIYEKIQEYSRAKKAEPWTDEKVTNFVERFSRNHPEGIAMEGRFLNKTIHRVFKEIPSRSRDTVYQELSLKGVGMTGAASQPSGAHLVLPFHLAARVGLPIGLSNGNVMREDDDAPYETVEEKYGPDAWLYSTDEDSWKNRSGRYGVARVKDGMIISMLDLLVN